MVVTCLSCKNGPLSTCRLRDKCFTEEQRYIKWELAEAFCPDRLEQAYSRIIDLEAEVKRLRIFNRGIEIWHG